MARSNGYSLTFRRAGKNQTVSLENMTQVAAKVQELKRNRRKLVKVVSN